MSLPNFICVGAQKSGTTSLQDILIQHPDIYLPKIKETHFFDNGEMNFSKGLSWYESEYFSAVKKEISIGEISPNYMFLDYIPKRIYEELGADVKLIFMLRNPIDRSFSQYMMARKNFLEKESFETALDLETERTQQNEFGKINFGYIQRGFYAEQIKRYLNFFPKEQMFFIVFETEFVNNRSKTIHTLCRFLDIPLFSFNLDIQKNVMRDPGSIWLHRLLHDPVFAWVRKPFKFLIGSSIKRERLKTKIRWWQGKKISKDKNISMNNNTHQMLKKVFQEDILELEKLINKDLSHWL